MIGRSNVGKSSLLNALAGRKDLAKVSSKPGRTQLLNLFVHDATKATLVDLPGYGYASTASKTDRAAWDKRMRQYLRQRSELVMTLALIDGEIGPTALDLDQLAWLRDNEVAFRIVATKHDKVKSSQRQRRQRDLAAKAGVEPGEVLWVSVTKNVGVDALRAYVVDLLRGIPKG